MAGAGGAVVAARHGGGGCSSRGGGREWGDYGLQKYVDRYRAGSEGYYRPFREATNEVVSGPRAELPASRDYSLDRSDTAAKERKKRAEMAKIIKKYDRNRTKKLERKQVIRLLTDTDFSTPPGTQPKKECVDFLFKLCDTSGDGAIDASELEEMLAVWQTFTEKREIFEQKLKQYDTSGNGALCKDELRAYLADLNAGNPVRDEDVNWIMKAADVVKDGESW